ncbi:hypothetical protein Desku_0926 [Desulfofundulus kuznetsovii DSM 6115]|uniref:Uncharacterized protein n=1 Tax=Desulfofundulus kuznetsovii (strain DSM 6115 / VKM B-1805 / 17) TaxID=760568 RepID=A0AAU8PB60_DESK7|nr:hypothetical protein Desku_0926 [Desulfofundulus kuznetsovii DSM 6115]
MDKVTYNHSDSHPEWLGSEIVAFIRRTPYEEMVEAARKIVLVSEREEPTDEQIEECRKFFNLFGDCGKQWYWLLRDAQGNLDVYLRGLRYMIDYKDFLADSLFCEWAYIINLDERIFEVYRGFQRKRDRNPRNRYRNMETHDGKYYPVKLVVEFPLKNIPGNWIEVVRRGC